MMMKMRTWELMRASIDIGDLPATLASKSAGVGWRRKTRMRKRGKERRMAGEEWEEVVRGIKKEVETLISMTAWIAPPEVR